MPAKKRISSSGSLLIFFIVIKGEFVSFLKTGLQSGSNEIGIAEIVPPAKAFNKLVMTATKINSITIAQTIRNYPSSKTAVL